MLRHATSGIEQLIHLLLVNLIFFLVDLSDPRTFSVVILVFLALLALVHRGCAKAFLGHIHTTQLATIRDHIAIELEIVNLRVTPQEPGLTIVVDHHGGVDMIPRAVLEEGLSDGILEGTCGRIAHCHANGHAAREFAVGADVPIELAIALDGLRSPGTVIGPRERLQGQGRTVVGPVNHIGGRINAPLLHPEEVGTVFIMAGIDIHRAIVYHWCGVTSAPGLHKGILC